MPFYIPYMIRVPKALNEFDLLRISFLKDVYMSLGIFSKLLQTCVDDIYDMTLKRLYVVRTYAPR